MPGWVEDMVAVNTAEAGGETLLLVEWHRSVDAPEDGVETWSAYRIGHRDAVWETDARSGEGIPKGRREVIQVNITRASSTGVGYWPLVVRRTHGVRERYVWNGQTLEREEAPTPAGAQALDAGPAGRP